MLYFNLEEGEIKHEKAQKKNPEVQVSFELTTRSEF